MEYVRYGDLSEYMKDHETAKIEAKEITVQILEALKILHGEQICHRDLKPQVWLLFILRTVTLVLGCQKPCVSQD